MESRRACRSAAWRRCRRRSERIRASAESLGTVWRDRGDRSRRCQRFLFFSRGEEAVEWLGVQVVGNNMDIVGVQMEFWEQLKGKA